MHFVWDTIQCFQLCPVTRSNYICVRAYLRKSGHYIHTLLCTSSLICNLVASIRQNLTSSWNGNGKLYCQFQFHLNIMYSMTVLWVLSAITSCGWSFTDTPQSTLESRICTGTLYKSYIWRTQFLWKHGIPNFWMENDLHNINVRRSPLIQLYMMLPFTLQMFHDCTSTYGHGF